MTWKKLIAALDNCKMKEKSLGRRSRSCSLVKATLTGSTRYAKTAPKSSRRRRTSTGPAVFTCLSSEVRCGGAAAREERTNQVVSSASTKAKKTKTQTTRTPTRSKLHYVWFAASVARRQATRLTTARGIPTSKPQSRPTRTSRESTR